MPRIRDILSIVKRCGIKKGSVALDVGAGSGAFALCLKKSKYFKEVIALDISRSCVSACKKVGLKSRLGSIADYQNDSVGLICINDLIEHLFDPLSFLKKCHAVLKSKGLIAIATPNGEGFDFKIMKGAVKNITPPEHLNYFNPFSIERVFKYSKFKVVSIETPGQLDVEMVDRARKEGFNLGMNNEYINYLLERGDDVIKNNLQKFISENKLSSHMLVVAQKE
jgi:SAM-dependent methyltransferase